MKVKDQLKIRREQLGVTVNELAKRLGVSAQAVRHWENGRSFPGKSKTAALETALSFSIDWTEGARAANPKMPASSLINPNDVTLLLQIARLPPPAKALIANLVDMHLDALGHYKEGIVERISESPVRPFYETKTESGDSIGSTHQTTSRTAKKQSKRSANRPAARRKAA